MSVSKTGVILFVILFFTMLSTFIGLYEGWSDEQIAVTGESEVSLGGDSFFKNVIQGYASLPASLNAIIFGTLGLLIVWLIYSSLPTIDGGS